jgi:lipopolysaccharide transport system permease protein
MGMVMSRPASVSASVDDGGWTVNRPTGRRVALPSVAEFVRFRELALSLALRDIQVRYKQTALGVGWAVLQPLAGAAVFTVVFGHLARLPSNGLPYVVFAFAGLTLWNYFAGSVAAATSSLVDNEAFVTKIYFPRHLIPLATALPGLADLVLSLCLLFVLELIYGGLPGPAVLLTPVWIALTLLFTFGIGCLFAAVNVTYRDVGHALPFATQLWLLASPVAYASSLAGKLGAAYYVNPMAGLLDAFRWSVTGSDPPPPEALLSLAVGACLVLGGLAYFGRVERRFADVI